MLGFRLFDEHGGTVHFDLGGFRLSLHPGKPGQPKAGAFLEFLVERGIDELYEALRARGVRFETEIQEEVYSQAASFRDPDGNGLFIWPPPAPDDPCYPAIGPLLRHRSQRSPSPAELR